MAARGAELDSATAAELRQLRALARQQAQGLDIKKSHHHLFGDREPMSRYHLIQVLQDQYLLVALASFSQYVQQIK